MIRILAAAALALAAFLGMAAPASACTTTTSTSVAVPAGEYVFAAEDGSGAMIGTANECYSYVIMDHSTDTLIFRDYGTDATGQLVPVTFCEGETAPYSFVQGPVDSDGYYEYILGDRL